MTSRRDFLVTTGLGVLAPAQLVAQPKPVRVGILSPRKLAESSYAPHLVRRLEELGYHDGRTMVLEYRSSDGVVDRYPKLARDLLEKDCGLIFAITNHSAQALHEARPSGPVVFLAIEGDPLRAGLVPNLRRPTGNFTGVYVPQEEMVAKRIEILREAVPVRHLLLLTDPLGKHQLESARKAAEPAGIQLTVVEFPRPPYDFEGAFETGRKANVDAVMLLDSPRFSDDQVLIAALLLKYRLPSVTFSVQHVRAGFLLAYSPNQSKFARRAVEIGVQILKGAKPVDIPVEQADEFELTVNAKTASALGVKMPGSVLVRATRVIE